MWWFASNELCPLDADVYGLLSLLTNGAFVVVYLRLSVRRVHSSAPCPTAAVNTAVVLLARAMSCVCVKQSLE